MPKELYVTISVSVALLVFWVYSTVWHDASIATAGIVAIPPVLLAVSLFWSSKNLNASAWAAAILTINNAVFCKLVYGEAQQEAIWLWFYQLNIMLLVLITWAINTGHLKIRILSNDKKNT
jgi:hypothetical protein